MVRPSCAAVTAPAITSTAWRASSPDARWGRPAPVAHAISARPIPRCCGMVAGAEVDRQPLLVAEAAHRHRTVEGVRVRHRQGALGAVDLDVAVAGGGDVEAGHQGGDDPGRELDRGGHVGGHVDVELLALARTGVDQPLRTVVAGHRRDPDGGAEELDEGGHVVRPHVEQWSRTPFVEDPGVGVPELGSGAHHEGGGGERRPDGARLDGGCGGLEAGAEERVGGTAEAEPGRVGEIDEALGLGQVGAEGLLAEGGLAGLEDRSGHRLMNGGRGQVDHDVDVGVSQELVDGARLRDALAFSQVRGPGGIDVGAGHKVQVVELGDRGRVGAADHPAAQDGDVGHDGRSAVRPSSPR